MQYKPVVSIVTIVRNDAEGFLGTARSVISQDYDNIEWVVIDGKSTDGTSSYVRQLSPFMGRYLIEPDSGIYNAMNKGIARVSGDWTFFLNSDDRFFDSQTVSTYISRILDTDDIVYSDVIRREDSKIHKYRPDDQWSCGMIFDHQTACVRTEIYRSLLYDERFKVAGDLDLFSRARIAGYSFRRLENVIGCIKPFHTGVSSSFRDRQEERIAVLKKYFYGPDLLKTVEKELVGAKAAGWLESDECDELCRLLRSR